MFTVNKYKIIHSIHFVLATVAFLGLTVVFPINAHAATRGCYDSTASGYTKVDCPSTGEIAQGVSEGKCYVRRSVDGGPLGAASFVEQQCDSFNTEPVTSSSGSGGDFTGGKESLESGAADACDAPAPLTSTNCVIVGYLVTGINFLSAIAGMAIVGSIMMAGYQYMTAKDNSGQVEAARKRIVWAMIALGIFLFMYSILNWLVPGGVI